MNNWLDFVQVWPEETKGRQFIRMALMKKVLHVPIEHLAECGNVMQVCNCRGQT